MVEKKEKTTEKIKKNAQKEKPEKKASPVGAKHAEKPKKEKGPVVPRPKSLFEMHYLTKCVPALLQKLSLKNTMEVPRLKKIVINTCLKEALQDIKVLQTAADELALIAGQHPVFKKSKKSIANFKLRAGAPIAAALTLRGARMYEFMNRLVNVAMPRVRDFKGVSRKSFDGRGNYTLGLTEQTIFPEINFDKVQRVNGMNITFVTTAKTDTAGLELLKLMGMPFRGA